jgi:hypothetical protein
MMKNKLVAASALIGGLLLAGCGGGPEQGGAVPGAPATSGATPGDESVSAVLLSAAPAPAQLRFLVASRPVVGTPFNIRLDVQSTTPVPALQLTMAPAAEFSVEPVSAVLTLATAGVRASQEIVVTPRQAGVSSLSVRLRAGAEGPEAEYAIPVMVAAAP